MSSPISPLFPGGPGVGNPATPGPAPTPTPAQQFVAKYVTGSPTQPAINPYVTVQKLRANGPGLPPDVVYTYNPGDCLSQQCATDLAALIGSVGGSTPQVEMDYPNGPSGLNYDSAKVAFFFWPEYAQLDNAADSFDFFTHGAPPDQTLLDVRADIADGFPQLS